MSSANAKPDWWYWWRVIKHFWWLFALLAVVAASASFLATRTMPQTYRAETWVEANPRARVDSELFDELENWQSGNFNRAFAQRPNVTELTLGFFLRSDEMQGVMRDVILDTMPTVLTRFQSELKGFGDTPSAGLDYWIKQNLVVDRNGKDQFYRLQWFFFTRTSTELQLEQFLERTERVWQQRLKSTLGNRMMALEQYRSVNPDLPVLAQNELSQLQLNYQTLDNMLSSEYLSVIRRLAPVEPTQGPVYPQLGKAIIIGMLPFVVIAGLLLKILSFRVQRLCK